MVKSIVYMIYNKITANVNVGGGGGLSPQSPYPAYVTATSPLVITNSDYTC